MRLLIRILITAGLVLLISHFMTSVHVANFTTSLIVAVVLGLLNLFIKPILVIDFASYHRDTRFVFICNQRNYYFIVFANCRRI